MNLLDCLIAELKRLDATVISSDAPQPIDIPVEVGRLQCELVALDAIGCAVRSLNLVTDRLASTPLEELKTIGEKLASQLVYLLEPISPIEVDTEGVSVQLRSLPPHTDRDETTYYELMVRRDGLHLSRFANQRGEARRVVPAQLTREVLLRLVGDLAAAVQS